MTVSKAMTANFGVTPYKASIPNNFVNWDSTNPPPTPANPSTSVSLTPSAPFTGSGNTFSAPGPIAAGTKVGTVNVAPSKFLCRPINGLAYSFTFEVLCEFKHNVAA
jgi:hypothetical protein